MSSAPTINLLVNPPAQDIRTSNNHLMYADDPQVRQIAENANTHQEYLDALSTDIIQAIQAIADFINITSGIQPGGYFNDTGTSFAPNFVNGHTQCFHMTGNATINPIAGVAIAGDEITIILVQDATGGRTVTWDATYLGNPGGFQPDPTASTATIYVFGVNDNSVAHLFLKSPPITMVSWP